MPVILFDGVCNLCNASVDFILRHDTAARFQFAATQSEAGRRLLSQSGQAAGEWLILLEGGRVYTASSAALRIAKGLRFPWPLLYALVLLPRGLRDAVYLWVARRRYRWFGRRATCRLPSEEERARFL